MIYPPCGIFLGFFPNLVSLVYVLIVSFIVLSSITIEEWKDYIPIEKIVNLSINVTTLVKNSCKNI